MFVGVATSKAEEGETMGLAWDSQSVTVSVKPVETFAEAWFTFTNQSGQPVKVEAVEPDCECLIARMDRDTYYPGESGVLLARIEMEKDRICIKKQIRVTTRGDHSGTRVTVLAVKAVRNRPSNPADVHGTTSTP